MMKLDKILAAGKRIALQLARREIERILAKEDRPADVKAEATEEGVVLSGPKLKARVVSDPSVRNAAR
jgi:hypothetical protein